jgi:nucleotide-binding universal stress UspA family protein
LLLGLANGNDVHIVSGDKNVDKASVLAKRAMRMCKAHGVEANYYPFEMPAGSVAEHLLEKVKELKLSMLVMGGFSHTVLHETFFGSCTKTLMRNSPVPLFMFH